MGASVSTAGDVNGDGYSDVMVSAHIYTNDQASEGRAYLYLGSSSGLNSTPAWTGEGNQDTAYYGITVASTGDVNGDGYADIGVISYHFDDPEVDEGKAFLYYGNAIPGLTLTPASRNYRNTSRLPGKIGQSDLLPPRCPGTLSLRSWKGQTGMGGQAPWNSLYRHGTPAQFLVDRQWNGWRGFE